jgi:hypothetical protein
MVDCHIDSFLISLNQKISGGTMAVLKLEKDDENREIEFELCYLKSLTTRERFMLMQKKSEEIKKMLRARGYRKSPEIVKRS